MIRFTFEGTEFTIQFTYKNKGKFTPGRLTLEKYQDIDLRDLPKWDKKGPCLILCDIFTGPIGSLDKEKEWCNLGTSFQNPVDQFEKEFGRRAALDMAAACFERDVRKAIWDVYNNRKPEAPASTLEKYEWYIARRGVQDEHGNTFDMPEFREIEKAYAARTT